MEFSHVDSSIDSNSLEKAKAIFDGLLLDLAVKETNYFCGTNLGGDNFKLLVLYGFTHELVIGNCIYTCVKRKIIWGVNYLLNTCLKQIRFDLENLFVNEIVDSQKYMGLAMKSLIDSQNFSDSCEEYNGEFPYIPRIVRQGKLTEAHMASMNNTEKLILACSICAQLSKDLDNGKTSLIHEYGLAMNKFDLETILLSVRKFIGIERIIIHNLDENITWAFIISKIENAFYVS